MPYAISRKKANILSYLQMYYLTCFSLSLQYLFYLYLNINKHTSLYEKYINIFNKYCNFSVECFYRTNLEPYFTHAKKII